MLEMEDMRVKEHLIRNSAKITSWNQMREEILDISRTQQYIDSQPSPMQLGAKSKGKRKGKGSFYCNKSGHVKAECRKRLKGGSPHHPNDTAAVVPLQCLLPGERHVNVRHSHALCEQRNAMRIFQ